MNTSKTDWRLLSMGLVACLLCLSLTVNAANGLKNPSFEDPLGSNTNGNNLDLAPVDWSTTGRPNLVRVDGTGYSGGPATAQTGIQYLDIINASGNTSQGFTLDAGNRSVSLVLGSRIGRPILGEPIPRRLGSITRPERPRCRR